MTASRRMAVPHLFASVNALHGLQQKFLVVVLANQAFHAEFLAAAERVLTVRQGEADGTVVSCGLHGS